MKYQDRLVPTDRARVDEEPDPPSFQLSYRHRTQILHICSLTVRTVEPKVDIPILLDDRCIGETCQTPEDVRNVSNDLFFKRRTETQVRYIDGDDTLPYARG